LDTDFGNPAIPGGPVAFRPTIARGLAFIKNVRFYAVPVVLKSNFDAKKNLAVKSLISNEDICK